MTKFLIIALAMLTLPACNYQKNSVHATKKPMSEIITIHDVLKVAHSDAEQAYRDLSIYVVKISRDGVNWRVDYELRDTTLRGGGPHYVISAETGEILSKQYDQ